LYGYGGDDAFFTYDITNDGLKDLFFYPMDPSYPFAVGWYSNELFVGCMDSQACNFNPDAITDNGTCCYTLCGCADDLACNYDAAATCDNGTCVYPGCTDAQACNFNPGAGCDDGSCDLSVALTVVVENLESSLNTFIPQIILNDITGFGGWYYPVGTNYSQDSIEFSFGCLPNQCWAIALNTMDHFDASAGVHITAHDQFGNTLSDDEYFFQNYQMNNTGDSIEFNLPISTEMQVVCICTGGAIEGCTSTDALNYNADATCEDGSCLYQFTGRVFFDENANGVLDGLDYGLAFQQLTVAPDDILLITNDLGFLM
jgi:hypothetical protein